MPVVCPFCRIVAGQLPASLVHEDDVCVAFLDIRPLRPGHLLVVPRTHAHRVAELDATTAAHLWRVAVDLGERLRERLPADDVHIVVNDGPAANQTVPHVHLHVVPRTRGDGARLLARLLSVPLAPLLPAARRRVLDALAARLTAPPERSAP